MASNGARSAAAAGAWDVTVSFVGDYSLQKHTSGALLLKLFHADRGEVASLDAPLASAPGWAKPELRSDDIIGWRRKGTITTAGGVAPCAVWLQLPWKKDEDHVYVSSIVITRAGERLVFRAESWVSTEHTGGRYFFEGTPRLPRDSDKAAWLREAREQELNALRAPDTHERKGEERFYGYQVYNDLSTFGKDGSLAQALTRPTLGGSARYPYPRRLATHRAEKSGCEVPAQKAPGQLAATNWLPRDERFLRRKDADFNAGAVLGALNAGLKSLGKPTDFSSDADVLELYNKKPPGQDSSDDDSDKEDERPQEGLSGLLHNVVDKTYTRLAAVLPHNRALTSIKKKVAPAADVARSIADQLLEQLQNWGPSPLPRVLEGRLELRPEVWNSDLEFGRQALAGINPCTLEALTPARWAQLQEKGSKLTLAHLAGDLAAEGSLPADKLMEAAHHGAKPRLFVIDLWLLSALWGDQDAPASGRVEHCGRAVLYLQQDGDRETGLVPLAIELAPRPAPGAPLEPRVYSRNQLAAEGPAGAALWTLAKAVFRSLESSHHQLVSHWLRTHCVLEPFLIALHRNLSAMHPVYKLMLPHFRYTLNINANARSALVNAGGIIETVFTPGASSMPWSSAAYKEWRFPTQALPNDLVARGMARQVKQPDGSSKVEVLLEDYPYAKDGLELWEAVEEYFLEYLKIFYRGDADVTADRELQAWWAEVKAEGHPDLCGQLGLPEEEVWGWRGGIPSVSSLARVLTTLAWLASGHHAAVNFGQYDYSGVCLNMSSLVRKAVPRHDAADPDYAALARAASDPKKLQAALLQYIADRGAALRTITTVYLLSTHAEDEQTLDMPNPYITGPEAAIEASSKFTGRMKTLELLFDYRNKDPRNWTRNSIPLTAGDSEFQGMPYTLLFPSSEAGITMRGVPFSVSI